MSTITKRTWKTGKKGEEVEKTAYRLAWKDAKGKRRFKQFPRRLDALRYGNEMSLDERAGMADGGKMTVGTAARLWLEACAAQSLTHDALEPHTLRSYKNHVTQFLPHIGTLRLNDLKPKVVRAFAETLIAENNRPSAHAIFGSFKSVLAFCRRQEFMQTNPAEGVKIKKTTSRDPKKVEIPDADDITKILNAADKLAASDIPKVRRAWVRYRPLMYTAIFTGMRASELRGLPRGNLDFIANTITVDQRVDETGIKGQPKSHSGYRVIQVAAEVMEIVEAYLKTHDHDLVFANGRGNPESHGNITNRCWRVVLDAAGVQWFKFHDLRHYYASALIAVGADLKMLQSTMGHNSAAFSVSVYGHLLNSDKVRRVEIAEKLKLVIHN